MRSTQGRTSRWPKAAKASGAGASQVAWKAAYAAPPPIRSLGERFGALERIDRTDLFDGGELTLALGDTEDGRHGSDDQQTDNGGHTRAAQPEQTRFTEQAARSREGQRCAGDAHARTPATIDTKQEHARKQTPEQQRAQSRECRGGALASRRDGELEVRNRRPVLRRDTRALACFRAAVARHVHGVTHAFSMQPIQALDEIETIGLGFLEKAVVLTEVRTRRRGGDGAHRQQWAQPTEARELIRLRLLAGQARLGEAIEHDLAVRLASPSNQAAPVHRQILDPSHAVLREDAVLETRERGIRAVVAVADLVQGARRLDLHHGAQRRFMRRHGELRSKARHENDECGPGNEERDEALPRVLQRADTPTTSAVQPSR